MLYSFISAVLVVKLSLAQIGAGKTTLVNCRRSKK